MIRGRFKSKGKKITKKQLLILFGLAFGLMHSFVMYYTFLYAYFCHNFVFACKINSLGEAHLELILIPISILVIILSIVAWAKED